MYLPNNVIILTIIILHTDIENILASLSFDKVGRLPFCFHFFWFVLRNTSEITIINYILSYGWKQ